MGTISFAAKTSEVSNNDTFTWTTPPTPPTSARVRVESVVSPTTVHDVSGPFTLRETVIVTVYLPLILRNYAPCLHLTDVTINGPASGSLVAYAFTAGVTPSNVTTPIIYDCVAEFITASSDPQHAGQFRLAATPNSTAVVGVISTAPGASLGAPNPREHICSF